MQGPFRLNLVSLSMIFLVIGCAGRSKPLTPHNFTKQPTFEEIGTVWTGAYTSYADPPLVTPQQAKLFDSRSGTLVVTGYPNDADWRKIRFESGRIVNEKWAEKLIARDASVSAAMANFPSWVKMKNNTDREPVLDVILPGNAKALRKFDGILIRYERSGQLYDRYEFNVTNGKVVSWSVHRDYEGD